MLAPRRVGAVPAEEAGDQMQPAVPAGAGPGEAATGPAVNEGETKSAGSAGEGQEQRGEEQRSGQHGQVERWRLEAALVLLMQGAAPPWPGTLAHLVSGIQPGGETGDYSYTLVQPTAHGVGSRSGLEVES